jgi:hypothetical protein
MLTTRKKKNMQPISYSLIINVLTLALCGFLAYTFAQPWLVIVAVLIQTHALERFREAERDRQDMEEGDDEPAIGFTANVK